MYFGAREILGCSERDEAIVLHFVPYLTYDPALGVYVPRE